MLQPKRFAGYALAGEWTEVRGGVHHLTPPSPPDYVRVQPRAIDGVKSAVSGLLRWSAKLLWLSPALWVAKMVVGGAIGNYLMVAFVFVAVVFFALLNVFVVVSALAWRHRDRRRYVLVPPHHDGAEQPPALPVPEDRRTPPEVGSLVTTMGDVVALGPSASDAGAVDLWSLEEPALRLSEATPFGIVAAGRLPVVVYPNEPPTLLGTPSRLSLRDAIASRARGLEILAGSLSVTSSDVQVEQLAVSIGDKVRITGVVAGVLDDANDFELDGMPARVVRSGDGTPYRDGERVKALVIEGDTARIERIATA
jgi:hypothetical protein